MPTLRCKYSAYIDIKVSEKDAQAIKEDKLLYTVEWGRLELTNECGTVALIEGDVVEVDYSVPEDVSWKKEEVRDIEALRKTALEAKKRELQKKLTAVSERLSESSSETSSLSETDKIIHSN
jgi:hypothetical protein